MGQGKRRAFSQSYQMLCSRKEKELKEAAGDINKRLRIAFEIWVDSWRITSDLSMQLEHIHQFSDEYGKIMQENVKKLCADMKKVAAEAYEQAQLISEEQELKMKELMQEVFSEGQDGKGFFGGEKAYLPMQMLWDGGELIEKLKEVIFVDGNVRADRVEYILQELLGIPEQELLGIPEQELLGIPEQEL